MFREAHMICKNKMYRDIVLWHYINVFSSPAPSWQTQCSSSWGYQVGQCVSKNDVYSKWIQSRAESKMLAAHTWRRRRTSRALRRSKVPLGQEQFQSIWMSWILVGKRIWMQPWVSYHLSPKVTCSPVGARGGFLYSSYSVLQCSEWILHAPTLNTEPWFILTTCPIAYLLQSVYNTSLLGARCVTASCVC